MQQGTDPSDSEGCGGYPRPTSCMQQSQRYHDSKWSEAQRQYDSKWSEAQRQYDSKWSEAQRQILMLQLSL
jgi:hypothetical protein